MRHILEKCLKKTGSVINGYISRKYGNSIYRAGRVPTQYVTSKEYILVIEGTAPAIVLQRCDSPNLSRLFCQTVR